MREHCESHAEIEKLLRQERDRAIADCESLTNALDELWTEHSRCGDFSTRVRDAEDKQREYQEIITRLRQHIVQVESERDEARRSYADVSKNLEVLKMAENEMRTSHIFDQEMQAKYAVLLEMHRGCERTIAELRNEVQLMKSSCGVGIYVAHTNIDSRVRVSKVHPGGAAWYACHKGGLDHDFLEGVQDSICTLKVIKCGELLGFQRLHGWRTWHRELFSDATNQNALATP
ncbi:hypothetical protein GUITHDRAFT_108565 [Guillardia theta CCMP2712]|uniref:Uncharacterized protein n=1 Tax=Guillardia theta (strain CCMP2712) TaxID=905079 RepID=L1JC74_GUITC|nr:hypothetical protein GUITHDRAFT_108565 [Guillardia theta CCMP2712]EKX45690.1 hypothetical protein GUITHDRAFT_108565 [Guillardia theta CCMP2712]|eukprot:XP_005832670.1 hypothetical protein GUITHDRAFT_108565 [Guillardia theta CCMP2712]